MIKNISTFGIVLMTALVVYRASTLNHALKIDGLYEREADASFQVENNNRLQTLELGPGSANLLALNRKIPTLLFQTEDTKKIRSENFQHEEHDSPTEIIEEPVAVAVL